MTQGEQERPERGWWAARRLRYTVTLAVAGVAAFLLYTIVVWSSMDELGPEAEITLFTTIFQGVGGLVFLGLANVCYGLGPLLERMVPERCVGGYRRWAYRAGLWFSCALPFAVPILLAWQVRASRGG